VTVSAECPLRWRAEGTFPLKWTHTAVWLWIPKVQQKSGPEKVVNAVRSPYHFRYHINVRFSPKLCDAPRGNRLRPWTLTVQGARRELRDYHDRETVGTFQVHGD
jgi:hypothetical protein